MRLRGAGKEEQEAEARRRRGGRPCKKKSGPAATVLIRSEFFPANLPARTRLQLNGFAEWPKPTWFRPTHELKLLRERYLDKQQRYDAVQRKRQASFEEALRWQVEATVAAVEAMVQLETTAVPGMEPRPYCGPPITLADVIADPVAARGHRLGLTTSIRDHDECELTGRVVGTEVALDNRTNKPSKQVVIEFDHCVRLHDGAALPWKAFGELAYDIAEDFRLGHGDNWRVANEQMPKADGGGGGSSSSSVTCTAFAAGARCPERVKADGTSCQPAGEAAAAYIVCRGFLGYGRDLDLRCPRCGCATTTEGDCVGGDDVPATMPHKRSRQKLTDGPRGEMIRGDEAIAVACDTDEDEDARREYDAEYLDDLDDEDDSDYEEGGGGGGEGRTEKEGRGKSTAKQVIYHKPLSGTFVGGDRTITIVMMLEALATGAFFADSGFAENDQPALLSGFHAMDAAVKARVPTVVRAVRVCFWSEHPTRPLSLSLSLSASDEPPVLSRMSRVTEVPCAARRVVRFDVGRRRRRPARPARPQAQLHHSPQRRHDHHRPVRPAGRRRHAALESRRLGRPWVGTGLPHGGGFASRGPCR